MPNVLSHNERATATWGSGGRDYDRISESVSDALAHLVNRIAPQPGERFLDVATGTRLTARLLYITRRESDRGRFQSRCDRSCKGADPRHRLSRWRC
jgi:hypothetical protein